MTFIEKVTAKQLKLFMHARLELC